MIKNLLLVGIGGGIGSILRYAVALLTVSSRFPYATLSVNISGSFIIGLVWALCVRDEQIAHNWKLLLATGICGGFTTFSAFTLENMQLLQAGKTGTALLYILVSIILGIAATFAGYQLLKGS